MAVLAGKGISRRMIATPPDKLAIKRALLEGPDMDFELVARTELPGGVIHRIRSFNRDAEEIGLAVSVQILKNNWLELAERPTRFLTTKKDNVTVSKVASAILVILNALNVGFVGYLTSIDADLVPKSIGLGIMANAFAAAAIFVFKTSRQAKEAISIRVDELTESVRIQNQIRIPISKHQPYSDGSE